MAYETAGRAQRVVASAECEHGQLVHDDGFTGRAIKTTIPGADVLRADRATIAAGESYNIRPRGVAQIPTTDIAGVAKGDPVFITTATNALSLAAGAGKVQAGVVTDLAGQRGCPTGFCRIDLEQKV